MACSAQRITSLCLLFISLLAHVANAQVVAGKTDFSSIEYKDYGKYYERITYIGKRKNHFIVDTYLKDSTLYRTDNYRVIDQGNNIGIFALRHGPSKVLYDDGRLYFTCDYNMNELNGPFIVYYNDGSIKRKELYRSGRLKKSTCYDTEGHEQPCDAFFQQVQFMGDQAELKTYLEKNLKTLLADNQTMGVSFRLIINEIGQIIDVKVDAGRSNARMLYELRKLVMDMPRWRENESNWRPASIDGIAIPSSWSMQAYRDRTIWRVSLP
jgi:hypothetical protein